MNNLPNTQTFLTIQDTAKLLKVSTKTLRRWEAKGTLVPVRTSGGHRRYTLSQVKEYKESLKIKKIKPQISGPVVLPTITTTVVPVGSAAIVNEIKPAQVTQLDNSLQTDPFEFISSTQPEPINIRTEEEVVPVKHKSRISAKIFASSLLLTGLMIISSAILSANSLFKSQATVTTNKQDTQVLAAKDSLQTLTMNINIPAEFKSTLSVDEAFTANQTATIGGQLTLKAGQVTTNGVTLNIDTPLTQLTGNLAIGGNTITSVADLTINPAGGGTKIGTGTPASVDLAGSDFFVSGDIETAGVAYIPTLSINGDSFTDLTGSGLQVSNGTLATTLGTSVTGDEIEDDSIKEVDLNVSNSPTNGSNLTYNSSTGGFTWATSTNLFTDGGANTYLTDTTDNFTVGSTSSLAKIAAVGTSDEIQLLAQGYSTQTSSIFAVKNSSSTNLFTVSNTGDVSIAGTVTLSSPSSSSGTALCLDGSNNIVTCASGTSITGTGTTGKIAKFTGTSVIGDSILTESGTTLTVAGSIVATGDLAVNGGNITTSATTANIFNATATTINIGQAATAISVGSNSGTTTFNHDVVVNGTLTTAASNFAADGASVFTPSGTNDVTMNLDSDSTLILNGVLAGTASTGLCLDASNNVIKCSAAITVNMQDAYTNDPDGTDVVVALSTADDSIIFRNPAASGTDSGYVFNLDQLATGAVDAQRISQAGTGTGITLSFSNAGTTATGISISNSAGTLTNAIDISDATGITNAINLGANKIKGTTAVIDFNSFDVDASGNVIIGGSATVGSLIINSDTFTDLTGNGLQVSGAALTLKLAAAADALSSTTSTGSGLEVLSSGLTMIQGCGDGQVLKWNESNDSWECANDTGASSAIVNVQNNGTPVGSSVDTLNFSTDFTVSASPSSQANISVADDILNFTEFSDSLVLDANTTLTAGSALSLTVGNNATITTTGTGQIIATDVVCSDCIALGSETTGNFVSTITAGNGITGSASSEAATPTIAVDQTYGFTLTGNNAFSPTTTNDITFNLDSDSNVVLSGLQSASGTALCVEAVTNNLVTCASGTSLTGSGTAGRIAKFTNTSVLADSLISESGTTIGLNTATAISGTSVTAIDFGAATLTFNGAGAVKTTTTNALTLDSGTTGTVNLGTGNNAKTVNIGTGTAGNTVNIANDNTTADTIALGSALDTVTIAGATTVNGSGSAATNIGTGTSTGTVTIGRSTGTDLALNDAQWSVTGAGAATFVDLTASGTITFAGVGTGYVKAASGVLSTSTTVATTDLTGTLFSNSSDSNAGTNTIVQGDTLAISGGTNGIDTSLSNDTYTINLDTTEIGSTTFGSGSALTWTFDASAGTDTTIAFGNNTQTFTTGTATFSGNVAVNGGDLTTTAGTATIFNANATSVTIGSAATTLSLGAATGTATIANATVNLSNGVLQTGGTQRLSNAGALSNITGFTQSSGAFSSTLTTTNSATFSSSTTNADSIALKPQSGTATNSFTGTITTADLTAARTYTLPDATGIVCLDTGNCAGAGGGITGSGTTNTVAKFTGSGTIGDSSISDDGTTVTIGANKNFALADGTGVSTQSFSPAGATTTATANTITPKFGVNAADQTLTGLLINPNTNSNADSGDVLYGINIENITGTVATETALRIGSGYDSAILFETGANDIKLTATAPTGGTWALNIPQLTADADICTTLGNCAGVGGTGTITGVTAGSGLTGGGTSGTVTLDIGAGTGIAVTSNAIAFDFSAALSGDHTLSADEAKFGASGLIFEGATANTIETYIAVTDPTTSDKTITIPDASGTVILSGHTFTSDVTATLGASGTTALTIASDAVALGTDTTGNYIATITGNTQVGVSGSGSETAGVTLSINTDSITASQLNATLTFADGDLLDLSAINNSSTSEGLKLPQNTSCASGTAEGQICWDTDGDFLVVGTGSTTVNILSSASSLFTAAGDSGSNQTISSGDTLTIAGGTNGIDTVGTATDIVTLNLDTTEIGSTTFGSGSALTWTFDASAGTDTTIAFGNNTQTFTTGTATFSGNIAVNGGDITNSGSTGNIFNTNVTTLSIGGAATTLSLGASTGTTTVNNALTTTGLLTANAGLTTSKTLSADSGTTKNVANITFASPVDTAGTNVSQAINIAPTIGNATGGTNTANFINIDAVTGDAQVTLNAVKIGALTGTAATETALNVGSGWDNVLSVNGTAVINGSGQVVSTQLTGTLFSNSSDSNAGTNTIIQGDTLAISGGTNGIDTSLSNDTYTINLDTTEIGSTTFGSGSALTWTFDASAGTDTTIAFGNDTQTFTTGTATFSGNETIQGTTGLTLSGASANISFSGTGTHTISNSNANSALTINSNGTGALTLDSTSTGTVNLGTSNNAKIVNIGTGTAGNTVNIANDNTTADTIALGSALDTLTIAGTTGITGATTVNGSGSAATNIGTGTSTGTITIGRSTSTDLALNDAQWSVTGAGVASFVTGTTIGSQTFTTNNIADSGALTIKSATGANALTLDSGSTGTVNLGTSNNAKTVNIATGTAGNAVNIASDNTTADTITIGSALDTLTIAGTTGITGATTVNGSGSAATNIGTGTSTGTITIGRSTGTDLALNDASWNITGAGAANFASIGLVTPGSGAFTTLSASSTVTLSGVSSGTASNGLCVDSGNIVITCSNAGSTTLQTAYGNDADGSDTIIALTTADDSLIFRNPAASGTDSGYLLSLDQLATGAVDAGRIAQAGTGVGLSLTFSNAGTTADGLIISNSAGTLTDAIDVSDATGITNAINVGANKILGTTAAIDLTNFDVASTGNVTVAAGVGIDTNASGTLAVGDTTATTVAIGSTAATTLNLGAGGALTRTINIGTGTGADTINIGTGATAADTLTFGNTGVATTFDFNSGATTTDALDLTFNSTTTANGVDLNLNGLTTGTGLNIASTSTVATGSSTGLLSYLNWNPGSATTITGDLFRINIGSNGTTSGNVFNVTDNGGTLFSVSETGITANVPAAFNAAGDVTMAYDLLFTNQTSSYIKALGPLTIDAGESFESNDLTLKTYNSGHVIADVSNNGGVLVSSNTAGTSAIGLLDVSGAATGKALAVFNESGDQNIITASASGTTVANIARTGTISVAAGQGLDTLAAGALALGNTTATSVSICNSAACDTISLGTNADADTITLGDSTDTVGINGTTTVLGATSINTSGSANTNIGTGTSTGTITIGLSSGTDLALADANWNVTGAGAANFASIGAVTAGTGAFTSLSANAGTTTTRTLSANNGSTINVADVTFTTPADSSGTNVNQGMNFTTTIGNATAGTNTANVINIAAITGDAQVTLHAINIGALTGTAATEQAINVAAGWDTVLQVGNNSIITGSGVLQSIALQGTYSQALTLSSTSNALTGTIGQSTALAGTFTTLASTGNTTIGDANTDTLTIAAGSSGTGITLSDTSFANCGALSTVSNVLTCSSAGGTMSSFTAAGDSGVNQTISNADTFSILGGTNGIDTVGSATDTITLNLDTTEIGTTTFGSGSALTWTFDASAGTDTTVAFGNDTITATAGTFTHSGNIAVNGGTITSTGDLTITPAGGDVILSNAVTLNIGGNGSDVAYNLIGDNTTGVNAGIATDNDLLVQGDAQVIGNLWIESSGGEGGRIYGSTGDNMTFNDAARYYFIAGNTTGNLAGASSAFTVDAGSLTTGTGLQVTASGASQTTDKLVDISQTGITTGFTGNLVNLSSTSTTGAATFINLAADASTVGIGEKISMNALTSGTLLSLASSSSAQSTGKYIDIAQTGVTTGYTGNLVNLSSTSTTGAATFINLTANASTVGVGEGISMTALTTGTGLSITGGSAMAAGGELIDLNMGAATAGNGINIATTGVYTGTGLQTITANSATTGVLSQVTGNGLTTGKLLSLDSSSTALTSGSLFKTSLTGASAFTGILNSFDWSPTSTTATGDLFRINIGASGTTTGYLFNVADAGSTDFGVSETQITSALPHQFTAAGDVSMAYDLQFTNQTASSIKAVGPLTIDNGESFESNNLTLRTYNSGNVIIDLGATAGKMSVGANITPVGLLTVDNTGTGAMGKAVAVFNQDESQAIITASASGTTIMTLTGSSTGDLIIGADGVNTAANIGGNGVLAYGAICADDTLDTADDCIDASRTAGTVYGISSSFTIDDIGENFPTADNSIEAADIVGLDFKDIPSGANPDEYETEFVKKSQQSEGNNVLGIISAKPGVLLGGWKQHRDPRSIREVAVALSGRVPTKVNSQNGNIAPGDFITLSSVPGVGMRSTNPSDPIVGKALDKYENSDTSATGSVLVFVNTQWTRSAQVAAQQEQTTDASASAALAQRVTNLESDFALKVNGSLTATTSGILANFADVKTNSLSVLGDTVLADTVINGKLNVGAMTFDNVDQSINAAGVLKIQSLALGNIEFQGGLVTIDTMGNVVVNTITAQKYNVAGASAGTATLPSGETEISVSTNMVTANSLIFVTPKKALAYPMAVTQKIENDHFVVSVSNAENTDIEFDWFIVDKLN